MAIGGYGVLRGRATRKHDATKKSQHYEVLILAGAAKHRIAVNVMSTESPHEVLYLVDDDYQSEYLRQLAGVTAEGFTPLPCQAGGAAVDYVRGGLFETRRMRPLPAEAGSDNDMNKVLDAAISRATADEKAVVYALGQRFPKAGAKPEPADSTFRFSPEQGIHDIHMNQGNPARGGHQKENGTWQDGALFIHFPDADRWVAVFIAFQSQSFKTGADGMAGAQPSAPGARQHRRDRATHPMAPLGISLSPMGIPPGRKRRREPGETFVATKLATPAHRSLRAYAFDPSRGRALGNEMTVQIGYRPVEPGPVEIDASAGDHIAIIDYDATAKRYYLPVNLDDPRLLVQDGLWPSESDPRFHQQMVYAVARETIEHFEGALGRRLHWRRAERGPDEPPGWKDEDIVTLDLHPHAMRAPNAYYSPDAHGILFGYFAADKTGAQQALPNQPVFTCLSHDIIVHEMTHAIVDGQRASFIEQTNRDVAAFHEGFADLAALFRHFSHREVLLDTLQRTGGRLYAYQLRPDAVTDGGATPGGVGAQSSKAQIVDQIARTNPLIELAQQFGDASGLRHALRSALGSPPTPDDYQKVTEPHARGSILVAAVFDAFFSIYVKRTSDLFAVYRAGGGADQPDDLPGPLARLLCDTANRTAEEFFGMCVRALDYCPPVDITFGEFLRALITAEVDRDPDDDEGIRDALMQAFRLRGILPDGARFFSEDALCWTRGDDLEMPQLAGLHFGDPNELTTEDKVRIAPVLHGYVDDPFNRERLGLAPDLPIAIPSFHPVFRACASGALRREMVVEVSQVREVAFDHDPKTTYPFRAGAGSGGARVRWVVTKPMHTAAKGGNAEARARHLRQQAYLAHQGLSGRVDVRKLRVDFALVHGGL